MTTRLEAVRRLAEIQIAIAEGASPASVALSLRELADLFDALAAAKDGETVAVPKKTAATADQRKIARELIEYWKKATGHETARTTPEREAKVIARLREGYDASVIRAAIRGCAASAFHAGDNPNGKRYDDITLICRNGAKLEGFAAGDPGETIEHDTKKSGDSVRLDALLAKRDRALASGNAEEYERINAEIERVRGKRDPR